MQRRAELPDVGLRSLNSQGRARKEPKTVASVGSKMMKPYTLQEPRPMAFEGSERLKSGILQEPETVASAYTP